MTRCVVPKCSGIGVHHLPKDPKLRNLWLTAIRREDWVPKNSSKICRKHFVESDYIKVSKYTGMKHQHRYLAKGVIPSVFPWNRTPTSEQSKVNMIIYRVYNYLEREYKCLKALNMTGCNLSILENILKRTSEATGFSEEIVSRIIKEQVKDSSEEVRLPTDAEKITFIVTEELNQVQTKWRDTAIEDMPVILANGPLHDQQIYQIQEGTSIEDIPVILADQHLQGQELYQSGHQVESDDVMLVGEDPYSQTGQSTLSQDKHSNKVTVKTEPLDFDRDQEMDITVTVKAEPFEGDLDSMMEKVQQEEDAVSSCPTVSESSQAKEGLTGIQQIEVVEITEIVTAPIASDSNREQEENSASDSDSWKREDDGNETSDSVNSNRDDDEQKNKKPKYTAAKLKAAVKAVDKGFSVNKASRKFGVPKSTIRDHKSKRHISTYCEAQTVLKTDEELALVDWLKSLKDLQFHLTKSLVFETVARMVKDLNRPNPFRNGVPGSHWYHKFSNRHPIVLKLITRTSALRLTHGIVRKWFARITKYFTEHNLKNVLEDPDRVFNCDEFGLSGNPADKQIIRREYTEELPVIVKERMTVVLNICANGKLAPPMVVYVNDELDNYIPQVPFRWGLSSTKTGWMDADALSKYILDCFYPWLVENGTQFPIILFLDGFTMRISPKLLDFCKEKGIFLIGLLTHGKYAIQPLDVGIVHLLEDSWKNVVENYKNEKNCLLDRSEFANQVKICLNACLSTKAIKSGFKNSYLCPFRPEEINYWKFLRKTKTAVSETNKKDEESTPS